MSVADHVEEFVDAYPSNSTHKSTLVDALTKRKEKIDEIFISADHRRISSYFRLYT